MKPSLRGIKHCGAAAWGVPCSMGFFTVGRGVKVLFVARQPCAHLASLGWIGRAVFGCLWAVVTEAERVPFYSWLGLRGLVPAMAAPCASGR